MTLRCLKSSVLPLNRKDKAIDHTSVFWIRRVVMKIPGPFLNFVLRQFAGPESSLVVCRSIRSQKLLADVYVGGRPKAFLQHRRISAVVGYCPDTIFEAHFESLPSVVTT